MKSAISKTFIIMLMAAVWTTPAAAGDKGLMGALIGAGAGAAIVHAVDKTGGSGKGALIGAIGGYIIGNQMEKSEEKDAVRNTVPQQTAPANRHDVASGTADCSKARTYLDQAPQHRNMRKRFTCWKRRCGCVRVTRGCTTTSALPIITEAKP